MNGNSRVKRRKGATRFAFNRHVYNPPCSPSPSYSRYLHLFALCSSEITRGMKLSQFVSNYKFHLSLNSFRQQFSTPTLSGEAEKRKKRRIHKTTHDAIRYANAARLHDRKDQRIRFRFVHPRRILHIFEAKEHGTSQVFTHVFA